MGTILGIGSAFLIEVIDRRIRSERDLNETLHMPVLGVVGKAKTSRRFFFPNSAPPALPAR
jgi:capsular polysaccharide biosynthesis protein